MGFEMFKAVVGVEDIVIFFFRYGWKSDHAEGFLRCSYASEKARPRGGSSEGGSERSEGIPRTNRRALGTSQATRFVQLHSGDLGWC
jgi:hypothetical protein